MSKLNKLSRRNFFQLAGVVAGTALAGTALVPNTAEAEINTTGCLPARDPLNVAGLGKCVTVTAKASPYQIQADETVILADSTEGPIKLILPPGVNGEVHTVKKVSQGGTPPIEIFTGARRSFKSYKNYCTQFYFSTSSGDWNPLPAQMWQLHE